MRHLTGMLFVRARASLQSVLHGHDEAKVVLLTGSTGNLGSYILETLLQDLRVTKVYTLNRPSQASKTIQQRQAESFAAKGLDASILTSSRLTYLEGEISHKNMGLTEEVYDELRNSITVVIHSAWRLDFNLALSSFESNIQGARNLIDLVRSSAHASESKFVFTSSVSSAFSWDNSMGPYPEDILKDTEFAMGNGYGESKYVTERILSASGLLATSLRIGQISGGVATGSWATTDWIPILVKSSIYVKAIPSAKGVVSWIPMDFAARIVLDIVHSHDYAQALNIVHPHPVTWASVISAINHCLVQEGVLEEALPVINMRQWITKIREYATDATADTITNIPAIKLLDFMSLIATNSQDIPADDTRSEVGGLPTFSTDKAQSISATMQALPQIGKGDAQRWVKFWKDVGYI